MPQTVPTLAAFQAQFPELTAITQAKVDRYGAVALEITGSTSAMCVLYLTAHLFSLGEVENSGEPDGGAGEIKQEMTGPYSRTFVTQASKDGEAFYTRTPYGRMFLELERRSPAKHFRARVFRPQAEFSEGYLPY